MSAAMPPTGRGHNRHPRRWLRLTTLLAIPLICAALAVVAWSARENQPIARWQELATLPEASLAYPGAVQLAAGGLDHQTYYQILGVDVLEVEVVAFYERELARRGWTTVVGEGLCAGGATSSGLAWPEADVTFPGPAWRKGTVVFALTPCDRQELPPEYARHRTIYLIAISPNAPADARALLSLRGGDHARRKADAYATGTGHQHGLGTDSQAR